MLLLSETALFFDDVEMAEAATILAVPKSASYIYHFSLSKMLAGFISLGTMRCVRRNAKALTS